MDPFIHHRSHRGPNLFPLEILPKQKGLFDTKLTIRSRVNLQADNEITGGGFKHALHQEYAYHEFGWPYDYEADMDYKMFIGIIKKHMSSNHRNNLEFLTLLKKYKLVLLPKFLMDQRLIMRTGPEEAPEPDHRNRSGYVWPSFIVWPNDPSYLSFFGSPETLELPKHVLRETRGHPEIRNQQSADYRPGIQRPWRI